jgi:hypothetical protein
MFTFSGPDTPSQVAWLVALADRALPPELVAGRMASTASGEFQRQALDAGSYFTKYQFSG